MLKKKEEITITGESVIDGKVVCGFSAKINAESPKDMSLSQWINDKEAYKANREICRKDRADFEDYAYERQEELVTE